MNTTQYDSRTADKFVARLPDGLRGQIEETANRLDRSMNSVIVQAVKQYLNSQNRQALLLDALARAVRTTEKSSAVAQTTNVDMQVTDPRDLFIKANPIGANENELEKGVSGFVDDRTHADYLIFLAGHQSANT